MTGRRWIILTIASILTAVGIAAAVAYAIDPYGVLRNPRGRKLAIYFSPRKTKFFLSERYVPSNFDGLIVGASSSGNWDAPYLSGARIYNESLDGANAVEERIVVNQALPGGHYKVAVFVLTPAITRGHDVRDGLDTTRDTEAIASIDLFVSEAAHALYAAHLMSPTNYASAGGVFIWNKPKRLAPYSLDPAFFRIDPAALEDYRALIQTLQDRGTAIVYVVSPTYEPCYQLDKSHLQAYLETVRPMLPSAPMIDFDAPEYITLRNDPDNFFDCAHVGTQGAEKVVKLLYNLVPLAIASEK